jgi:DNA-binding transcriptional LysR family regulator
VIDVPRLRLLRAVVATGSIRATASMLGYTPSAVSQQLASLQRQTGLRLLERAGRGIEPTAAARTLATESGPLFEELSRVDAVIGDLRAGRVGSLSIAYFASAGAAWLPAVAATLRDEFPELRLRLAMTEMRGAGMPDPDIHIFVEGPGVERPANVDVHRLVDDPYVVVVRATDPIAALSEVPLAELAGRRWIDNDLNDGSCRQVVLGACAEAGFTPSFSVETHDYQTAIPFVATGIGITVIPRLGAGDLPAGLTAVSVVAPTPVRRISVAVKKSMAQNPAANRAVQVLRDIVSLLPEAGAAL